jgi:hypothetical protein
LIELAGPFEKFAILCMMKNRMEDNRDAPVTRGDLEGEITGLEARLNERYDILRSEMQHLHQDVVERLGDTETRLLTAFYSFEEPSRPAPTRHPI